MKRTIDLPHSDDAADVEDHTSDAALDTPLPPDVSRDLAGWRSWVPDLPLMEPADLTQLDPQYQGHALHELYPSRYVDASPAADEAVRDARESSDDPAAWADRINPRQHSDSVKEFLDGSPQPATQNCADCSRAVIDTLAGDARAARGLRAGGLPLDGDLPTTGEAQAYTERWAGHRAEILNFHEIEQRLIDAPHGERAAIVFGYGERSGHAFDAVRADDGRVLLVDGQQGTVRDWDPDLLARRYDLSEAIFFDDTGSAT